MGNFTIDPQGLRRRTWLLGAAIASIGLQGIAMYLLSTQWLFLSLGILFLLLLPIEVIDRVENRTTFSVIANWLIAFGGSLCFLKVSTACFMIVLSCNLLLLASCIAILYNHGFLGSNEKESFAGHNAWSIGKSNEEAKP